MRRGGQREPGRHELVEVDGVEEGQGAGSEAELIDAVQEAPEAEGLQPVDVDVFDDFRVGPAGDDVHLVPQARQLSGEVVQVDALAARVHVALVHDEADAHQGCFCP
jgi:hypothetical protein